MIQIGDRVVFEDLYMSNVGEIISIAGGVVTVQWETGGFQDFPLDAIEEVDNIHEVNVDDYLDNDGDDLLDDIGDIF